MFIIAVSADQGNLMPMTTLKVMPNNAIANAAIKTDLSFSKNSFISKNIKSIRNKHVKNQSTLEIGKPVWLKKRICLIGSNIGASRLRINHNI